MIVELLEFAFLLIITLILAYGVRHYLFTITVLKLANKPRKARVTENSNEPYVSILVPAHNEEKVIERLLKQLTLLTYPKNKLHVIVVNDASFDQTGRIAEKYSQVYDFIEVLHRDKNVGGKGKASAMNAGLQRAIGEIILCFDADYYPQKDIVEKLVEAFVDPKVGAVQGRVVVLNEPQNIVTRLVALERIGGYRVDQEARDSLGLITQFGGTVGAFRHSVLEKIGGWDPSVLAEDTDLTFKVYLAGYKIRYKVDAECYEEAVDNWRAYWHQRVRWAKGHMQCFFRHCFQVLKSSNLNTKEKIDGLMILSVYFMPLLVFFSSLISILLLFLDVYFISYAWFFVPVLFYCFAGNFAPFYEVGIGVYLDNRTRTQWLIPLLIFTFLYNIPICMKALLDIMFNKTLRKKGLEPWYKTVHLGQGNSYIKN